MWEFVFVGLELLLKLAHVGGVFVEEYLLQKAVSLDFCKRIQNNMRLTVP